MSQFNIPKKKAALMQVWVSIFLIGLTVIMSFTPIIKLKASNSGQAIAEVMSEFSDADIDVEAIDKYEYVDITAPGLVNSTKLMIDIISVSSDVKKGKDVDQAKVAALEETLKSENGIKSVITAVAIIDTFTDVFESDDGNNSATVSAIFSLLIVICIIFGILGLTVALPIVLAVIAIIAVISALTNVDTPEAVAGKIGGKLTGILSLPLVLMLFQCLIPGLTYGFGTVAIVAITCVSVIFGAVMARTVNYTASQSTYINIVQGASAVGIVGFFIFFFGLLNTNVFSNVTSGGIFDYITHLSSIERHAGNADLALPNDYIVDLVILAFYVVFVFTSLSYIEKASRRLSCTSGSGDGLLAAVITTVPVFVLPVILKFLKHRYNVTFDAESGLQVDRASAQSFLKLADNENMALILVLVGIIIMLAAEITLIVLKRTFCSDMDIVEMNQVVSGELLDLTEKKEESVEISAPAEEPTPAPKTDASVEEEITNQD